jgi:hypothetical protein
VRAALALKTATVQPDATANPSGSDVTVIVGRDYDAAAPQNEASTLK